MTTRISFSLVLLILIGATATIGRAQVTPADTAHLRPLPAWADSALTQFLADSGFVRTTRVTPSFLVGDFDGDGWKDAAVLVRRSANGKEGVAIFRRYGRSPIVLGCGQRFGDAGDDWTWMDAWHPEQKSGHMAIYAEHSESGGGYIEWDGHRFKPFVGDD
jgi:hypothetical protein